MAKSALTGYLCGSKNRIADRAAFVQVLSRLSRKKEKSGDAQESAKKKQEAA